MESLIEGILTRYRRDWHMKRQQYFKLAALSHRAADFNTTVVVLDDAVGEREAEAGAIAFGGVKRPENVGQILGRDAASGVADHDAGTTLSRTDLDPYCAWTIHRLNCVQEQIQKHLVNLIAVMLDLGKAGCLLQFNLDRSGEYLLTRQHHGVFNRGIEVAPANFGT